MWALFATKAYASALTMCGAALVDSECREDTSALERLDVAVSCHGSSSAPGGPVSHFEMDPVTGPVTLSVHGVPVAIAEAPSRQCDGENVFTFDVRGGNGMLYGITAEALPDGAFFLAGSDSSKVSRCGTNPKTCAPAIEDVPRPLEPWMHLSACLRGESCSPAKRFPVTAAVLTWMRPGCLSGYPEVCTWLDEVEPDHGWGLIAALGTERVSSGRVRAVPPGLQVWWDDTSPVLSSKPLDPPRLRSIDGKTRVEVRPDGVTIRKRKRELWSWSGSGVRAAALRPDGDQVVLLFPTIAVNLAFGEATKLEPLDVQGQAAAPSASRSFLSGTVLRPDGWPAAGVDVSARCLPTDQDFKCKAVADLQGRFDILVHAPSDGVVRLQNAHVDHVGGQALGVVVIGLPVLIPESARFDFEVDENAVVVAASGALKIGDRLLQIGPLPIEAFGNPRHGHYGEISLAHAAILANGWGWLEVERGGARISL